MTERTPSGGHSSHDPVTPLNTTADTKDNIPSPTPILPNSDFYTSGYLKRTIEMAAVRTGRLKVLYPQKLTVTVKIWVNYVSALYKCHYHNRSMEIRKSNISEVRDEWVPPPSQPQLLAVVNARQSRSNVCTSAVRTSSFAALSRGHAHLQILTVFDPLPAPELASI